jgi:hypothetical protein
MKKYVGKIRLAVFLMAVMGMVLGTSMTVHAGWSKFTVTHDAPLRKYPEKGDNAYFTVRQGATIQANLNNEENRFVRAKYNGQVGWFFRGYLIAKSSGSKSSSTSTPMKVLYRAQTTNKQKKNLSTRMHRYAQLTSETIRKIPAYTTVPVYQVTTSRQVSGANRGRNIEFAYVSYDRASGWVATSELVRVD